MPPKDPSEILQWTKDHKTDIVNHTLQPYHSSDNPTAIFMAGLPGAGKTEFLNNLSVYGDEFITIDLDFLVSQIYGYSPENYYNYRKAGNILVSALFDKVLKQHISFALDGTFAHPQALKNIERTLKHNFLVNLFLVAQKPDISWRNTQARQLITKRPINRDGFVNTCHNIIPNLQTAFHTFRNNPNFSMKLIKKNPQDHSYKYTYDAKKIDEELTTLYNMYQKEL